MNPGNKMYGTSTSKSALISRQKSVKQSFSVGDGTYGVVEILMLSDNLTFTGNSTNGQHASSTFTSNCEHVPNEALSRPKMNC